LVIGDRALLQRVNSKFIYDLGQGWKQMTGLPFVFASWIANKKLPDSLIASFSKVTSDGFQHINEIVRSVNFPGYDMHQYYTANINYRFDKKKEEALALFLNYVANEKKLDKIIHV
jgi:chorismate dehydratase